MAKIKINTVEVKCKKKFYWVLTTANFAASFAVDDCQCDFRVCSSHSTPDGAELMEVTGPAATISSY